MDVHVKRGDLTLPISEIPNLLPGDRLWIHPDLPESQAAHFVLVVAFLRGSTNPPPPEWFTGVETWTRDARDEGVFKELRCPRSVSRECTLGGSNLFLAASFAATPSSDNPTDVPPQFTGAQLIVLHPVNCVLYLKLRDDPETVQTSTFLASKIARR